MNGNGATVEERMERKRALEQELELIRNQKAEVLRAIQQIAKKQKTGQPLRTTHMTHEAKIDTERRYHAEQMKRIWGNCSAIMKELLKNTSTKLYFGEPVHRDKFPGYYEVIKEPRDLGTIQAQLNRKEYKDIYAFLADVRLCFENCRLFNPLGHPVRKMGDTASDNFEKKWLTKNVEADWEQEIRRHNLTIAKLEAEAKSLPEKVAEVNNELQELAAKVAARESLPAPGPGREMTFEEKRKLSHDLTEIPGERLARVLEIISEDPSAPEGDDGDDDGLELELECLLPETLWKVYAYVETVQAEIRNKAPPSATAMAAAEAAAAAAATGDGATAGGAAAAAPAAPNAAGSDDDEGVGSKGNADSTGAADPSKSMLPAPVHNTDRNDLDDDVDQNHNHDNNDNDAMVVEPPDSSSLPNTATVDNNATNDAADADADAAPTGPVTVPQEVETTATVLASAPAPAQTADGDDAAMQDAPPL